MKKLLVVLMLTMFLTSAVNAQDNKDKVKPTSTVGQKVHNTFSKHKKYSGYKTKREHRGIKRKHKVNYKKGKMINKSKKD